MTKKRFPLFLALLFLLLSPNPAFSESSFEFIFFGVNIKALEQADWKKVAVGALASILVHELGHALYLEMQGKDWDLKASGSGFAIQTSDVLSDEECREFGRAGFLLQTSIGLVLTSFEKTRQSDFTKGWTAMNVAQVWSYNWRSHDEGDDFAMIDRGHGDGDSDHHAFCFMSMVNFMRIDLPMAQTPLSDGGWRTSEGLFMNRDFEPGLADQRDRIRPYPQVSFGHARFSGTEPSLEFDTSRDWGPAQSPSFITAGGLRPRVKYSPYEAKFQRDSGKEGRTRYALNLHLRDDVSF